MVGENTAPLEERCKKLIMNFPEITRKPTYHTKPKQNQELEVVLDNYKPTMVKARRPGGRRAAIQHRKQQRHKERTEHYEPSLFPM